MRERFHLHYIDGRWTPSASGETLPVINPADGTTVARIPAGAPEDADRAAEAAARVSVRPGTFHTAYIDALFDED